jgi:homeobox protein cut-like
MDDLIAERVAQKENELNATYDERMRNYEEREKDLVGQVATVRSQLADLRTSNDSVQTRLLDASQRQDSEVVAKLGELDLVVADLERANGRVAAVERRNELLRAEIESVRSGSEEVSRARKMEGQLAELEGEAARLLRALEGEKDNRATERRAAERKVDELQREAAEKAREAETLRRKTREFHDYDEIKRELEIMKVCPRFASSSGPHPGRRSLNSALRQCPSLSSLAGSTLTKTRTPSRQSPAKTDPSRRLARWRCRIRTRPRPIGGLARASRSF